ncbi:hypothetical protein K1X76_05470 [bacterium]|nr:hypothetical protein [bacterium]
MNTLHPKKEELFDYYTKTISGRFANDIAEHIKNCDNCKNLVADFEKIENTYHHQTALNPSDKTLAFIQNYASKKRKGFFFTPFLIRRLGLVMSLVVVASLGYLNKDKLLRQQKPKVEAGFSLTTLPDAKYMQEPIEEKMPEASPPVSPTGFMNMGVPQEGVGSVTNQKADDGLTKKDAIKTKVASKPEMPTGATNDKAWTATFQTAQMLEKNYKYTEASGLFLKISQNVQNKELKAISLFHLAHCQKELGQKEEALKTLNTLKELAPDYPGLDEALKL